LTTAIDDGSPALCDLFDQAGAARRQVDRPGTVGQIAATRDLLDERRRGVYRILASDGRWE